MLKYQTISSIFFIMAFSRCYKPSAILFLLMIMILVNETNCVPRLVQSPTAVDVVVGNEAEFACILTGSSSDVSLKWQIQFNNYNPVLYPDAGSTHSLTDPQFGSNYDRGHYQVQMTTQPGNVYTLTLKISGVTRNDAGMFACAYQYNVPGYIPNQFHSPVSLNVLYPPVAQYPLCSFTTTPISNPHIPGQVHVQLSCNSDGGNPPATLSWHNEETGDKLFEGSGILTITIIMLPAAEVGKTFSCRAASEAIPGGFRSCSVTPIPTESPTTTTAIYLPPGNPTCRYRLEEHVGNPNALTLYLTCEWNGGNPSAQLSWKDNRAVPIGSGSQASAFISREDFSSDQYTCYASHPALTESRTCLVRPVVPPLPTTSAPTTTPAPIIPPGPQYPQCSFTIQSPPDVRPAYVKLICTSQGGTPPAQLTWYDSNGIVLSNGGEHVIEISTSSNQLFTCEATIPAIYFIRSCSVTPELPPVPPNPGSPTCSYQLTSLVGNTDVPVLFTCNSDGGYPPANLQWLDSNNNALTNGRDTVTAYMQRQIMRGVFYSFTCRATSPAITTDRSCTTTVQLPSPTTIAPPLITTAIPLVPPNPGSPACSYQLPQLMGNAYVSVLFTCNSNGGYPSANLQWFDSNDNTLTTGPNTVRVYMQRQIMRGVFYSFTCRATGPAITTDRSCTTTVQLPSLTTLAPPITTVPLAPPDLQCRYEIEFIQDRARIALTCESSGGNPESGLRWFSSESPVPFVGGTGKIDIPVESVVETPFIYECRAMSTAIFNPSGFQSCFVNVLITVPSPSTAALMTTQKETTQPSAVQTMTQQTTLKITSQPLPESTQPTTPRSSSQTGLKVETLSILTIRQTRSTDTSTNVYSSSTELNKAFTAIPKLDNLPPPSANSDNVMAIVGISVGVILLLIIVILMVGCILRGVVRKNVDKFYGTRRFTNPTSNSMMSHRGSVQVEPRSRMSSINEPTLHPFGQQGSSHIVNPIFQEPENVEHDDPKHPYFTTVEDMNMNNKQPYLGPPHAYEDLPDLNPTDNAYEYVVPNINANTHIYDETS